MANVTAWVREASDDQLLVAMIEYASAQSNLANPQGVLQAKARAAEVELAQRNLKRQTEIAQAQAGASAALVRFTRRLVMATWLLVGATVVAALVLAWVTWKVGTGPIRLG